MTRPSKHTDKLLLTAARKIFPKTGCRKLNLRHVAKEAGVNLGMFSYYFKTKEEFTRQLLQEFYEDFFKDFRLESGLGKTSLEKLRSALLMVAKFARDNRQFLFALMTDLMSGEEIAIQFTKDNITRHGAVLLELIEQCKKDGFIDKISQVQILSFMMTGVNFPTFIAGHLGSIPGLPKKMIIEREELLLSDMALTQRVEMALRGITFDKSKLKRGLK